MKIRHAVLTAAGQRQRTLPLQRLVDRDGVAKCVLRVLVEEAVRAGVEEIAVVVRPGDEEAYAEAAGPDRGRLTFVQQVESLGYAHALSSARSFLAGEPFLHMVGDHVFAATGAVGCAEQLCRLASVEGVPVSGVQATRETELWRHGAVQGQPLPGSDGVYTLSRVIEKPTPTRAEQELQVPGLRAGHYLCFFGMHVLTPAVLEAIEQRMAEAGPTAVGLSDVLDHLARRERCLGLRIDGRRFDLGEPYGLLAAQLALGLDGRDREQVLDVVVEVFGQRARREFNVTAQTGTTGAEDAR